MATYTINQQFQGTEIQPLKFFGWNRMGSQVAFVTHPLSERPILSAF